MHHRPVVFLMGPTASGKTDLAAALFDRHDAELISVDAAQVYRGMDIGTAKPAPDLLRRYPHHLIDIRAPDETWNAAAFRDHALALIGHIHARGKLPILVGGSMFYFAALENGLSDLPGADPGARRRITREIHRRGAAAMHQYLQRIDAESAAAIRPSDTQRLQRALEIHHLTGRAPSQVMRRFAPRRLPFALIKLGLFTADRHLLHARIETRFRRMLARGLIDEVQAVAATLDHPERQPSMRTVGYRQVLEFLRNQSTCQEMTAKGIAATRQLAKRQLTWMRQQSDLVWVDASAHPPVDGVCAYLQNRIETLRGGPAPG